MASPPSIKFPDYDEDAPLSRDPNAQAETTISETADGVTAEVLPSSTIATDAPCNSTFMAPPPSIKFLDYDKDAPLSRAPNAQAETAIS